MNLTCWDEGNPDSWTVIGLLTEIQVARWLFRASQVMDRHSTTMEVDGTSCHMYYHFSTDGL